MIHCSRTNKQTRNHCTAWQPSLSSCLLSSPLLQHLHHSFLHLPPSFLRRWRCRATTTCATSPTRCCTTRLPCPIAGSGATAACTRNSRCSLDSVCWCLRSLEDRACVSSAGQKGDIITHASKLSFTNKDSRDRTPLLHSSNTPLPSSPIHPSCSNASPSPHFPPIPSFPSLVVPSCFNASPRALIVAGGTPGSCSTRMHTCTAEKRRVCVQCLRMESIRWMDLGHRATTRQGHTM